MTTNTDRPLMITPTQVEGWLSGVLQIRIAADDLVTVFYENSSQISAKLEFLPHAIQSNFFALVRRVQNASFLSTDRPSSLRLV